MKNRKAKKLKYNQMYEANKFYFFVRRKIDSSKIRQMALEMLMQRGILSAFRMPGEEIDE